MSIYRSGPCPVLVTGEAVVMAGIEVVDALTGADPSGASVSEIVAGLTDSDTSFAAVTVDGDGLSVTVRGQFSVHVGDEVVANPGEADVLERRLPWSPAVTVHSGHAAFGPSLPVSAGVVLASTAEWRAPKPEPASVPAPDPEPSPVSASGDPAGESVSLHLPTGEVRELTGVVVFGRAPQNGADEAAVVVDNPHVSATHLRLELRDGAVVATDLSSNGTLIQDPDGARSALANGVETTIPPGWSVLLATDYLVRLETSPSRMEEG